MRGIVFCCIGVVCSAILFSCTTTQTRRDRFVSAHPELPQAVKAAIESGEIVQGMSPDEVRASWGEPSNRLTELAPNGGRIERWQYSRPYGGYTNIYEVRFFDGQVRSVTSRESRRVSPRPPPTPKYIAPQIASDVPNARRYLEQRARLRLTSDQVNELERIRRQYRVRYNETQNFINLDQTQLHTLSQSSAPDPSLIQETMDDITRLQTDLRNTLVRAMQDAQNVLSPEQRSLLPQR